MTESTNQSPSPVEAQRFSRRTFMKGVGALAGAAVLTQVPNFLGEVPTVKASEVKDGVTSSWSGVDFVEGEPQMKGEVVLPKAGIFKLNQAANRRTENSTRGGDTTKRPTSSGALFEGVAGEENLADLDKSPTYTWTGGNLIYENGQLVSPEHAYVANNQNFFDYVTDPNTLPSEVQELYRTASELPDAITRFDVAQMDTLFDNIGGSIEFDTQMAQAWGKTLAQGEQPFEDTVVGAWQRSVTMAALITDASVATPSENICEIVNSGGTACNYSRYIDPETGEVDIISRFQNSSDPVNRDIYVVTRFDKDKQLKGLGTVTSKGLAVAYGKDAINIAENTTAFNGQNVVSVLQAVDSLDESQIFLAGLDRKNQFAQKIIPAQGNAIAYRREGNAYKAAEIIPSGEISNEYTFISSSAGGGEWLTAPEGQNLHDIATLYAEAHGLDVEAVKREAVLTSKTDAEGNTYLFLTHNNIPLMEFDLDEEGNMDWVQAKARTVGSKRATPIYSNVSVDGAEDYGMPAYQRTYKFFSGLSPSGSFLQQTLERYPEISKAFLNQASNEGMSMRVHTSFFHQVINEYFNNEGNPNPSKEEVDAFINRHITGIFDNLDPYKDGLRDIEVIFANEMKWNFQGNSGWEQSPLHTHYGTQWPVETYVRLYQEAVRRGYTPGEDIQLMYNDYGIEMDGAKADMVRSELQRVKVDIAQRLGLSPEEVPMTMGLQFAGDFGTGPDGLINGRSLVQMDRQAAIDLIAGNITKFASLLPGEFPVKITEIRTLGATEDEIAEYVYRVARGLIKSGKSDSIGFWSPLRWRDTPDDRSLFDKKITKTDTLNHQYSPRKPYYALLKALYEE